MKLLTLSVLTVLSMAAKAAPSVIQLGQPSYGGNGCPAGSVIMRMNADGQGFVVATQYTAEAGGTANKRIDRKSCALALPVRVASGYQVALVTTLSGFVSSEVGTTVRVDHEQFYAGAKGVKLAKVYSDAKQRFLLSTSSSPAKLTWSQCGDDTNLRLNTSVTAQSNQAMDLAVGGIGDMRFRVVSRKCQ